jgi:Ca2+-binding EF-hand superfamily protein
MMREVVFVRMLQQFDTNKDGQISKDEAKNGMETIFAAIDTNNDGSLTPGEIRKYHEAQMAKAKAPADDMAADDDAAPAPPPADADAGQPAPPQDEANRGPGRHGMRGPGMIRELMIMQRIDTDENGQISKQEAEAAFDKFFTRMDTNKDGVISIADMPQRPFL